MSVADSENALGGSEDHHMAEGYQRPLMER